MPSEKYYKSQFGYISQFIGQIEYEKSHGPHTVDLMSLSNSSSNSSNNNINNETKKLRNLSRRMKKTRKVSDVEKTRKLLSSRRIKNSPFLSTLQRIGTMFGYNPDEEQEELSKKIRASNALRKWTKTTLKSRSRSRSKSRAKSLKSRTLKSRTLNSSYR